MNPDRFTHAAQEALQSGQSMAATAGHAEYSPMHLLSALVADARAPGGRGVCCSRIWWNTPLSSFTRPFVTPNVR